MTIALPAYIGILATVSTSAAAADWPAGFSSAYESFSVDGQGSPGNPSPTFHNADPIATWKDLGPDGRDLVQATGASKPTYRTSSVKSGLNPAVRFDGANDSLASAVFTPETPGVVTIAWFWEGPVGPLSAIAFWLFGAYKDSGATNVYVLDELEGFGLGTDGIKSQIVGSSILNAGQFANNGNGRAPGRTGIVALLDGANSKLWTRGFDFTYDPSNGEEDFPLVGPGIVPPQWDLYAVGASFPGNALPLNGDVISMAVYKSNKYEECKQRICKRAPVQFWDPLLVGGSIPHGSPASFDFSANLQANGKSGFTITQIGSLPPGMTDTGAVISGTPTTPGSYPLRMQATSGDGFIIRSNLFTITVT